MDDLKIKVENVKKILLELINTLEQYSIDTSSLKKTYVLFDITKNEQMQEELLIWVSKLINDTMKELEITTKKISKIKNVTNEKIDNYNDSEESEKILNNI